MHKCIAVVLLVAFATEARAVTIQWSPVGNPGNAADPATGHGAVGHAYQIGTYDVTNRQYAEFLNAKDPTGANALGLYHPDPTLGMANTLDGGINLTSGNAIGSKYTLITGDENHPVNCVTWYDAIRFANWVNNGQGNGDTESGAYTLLGGTPTPSNGSAITRNPGATIFLPSADEWYKAAYFSPSTHSYFQYPTGSNAPPIATAPPGSPNSANYGFIVGHPTDVGAYTGTMSPYGAFDMGGNVFQWDETLITLGDNLLRGIHGGSFTFNGVVSLAASSGGGESGSQSSDFIIGFRLAEVPEPSSLVLAALGLIGLAAWGWRKRA